MAPNYEHFHSSISDELFAARDRLRNLVSHWQTDGESKEAVLRSVLRRHLPSSVRVGRGFVVTKDASSTQIDILIADAAKPTLFRDGDLMVVTPDAVRAVIEVKTTLRIRSEIAEAASKLTRIEELCRDVLGRDTVWTGLFSYNETPVNHEQLLQAIGDAYHSTRRAINCVSLGRSTFARFWQRGADVNGVERGPVWHSYELPRVAPSYFIGNLIDAITSVDNTSAGFAWFPTLEGDRKENRRQWYLPQNTREPSPFSVTGSQPA